VFFGLFSAYFRQIVNPQITRAYDDQNSPLKNSAILCAHGGKIP
jgi:hypothetical protein